MRDAAKKIIDSQDAFIAGRYAQKLAAVFETLASRPLGTAHFQQAKNVLRERLKASPAAFCSEFTDTIDQNPAQPLKKRKLNFRLGDISADKEDPEVYAAYSTWIVIRQEAAAASLRPYPVNLQAAHVERRYVARTCKPLHYDTPEFLNLIRFSIPLSIAMGSRLSQEDGPPLPCVLPHPEGLFFATAHPSNLSTYDVCFAGSHSNIPGKSMYGRITQPVLEAPSLLFIRTFVHTRMLSKADRTLHQTLLPFLRDEQLIQALKRVDDIYIRGPWGLHEMSADNRTALEETCSKVAKIVDSPLWRDTVHLSRRLREEYGLTPASAQAPTPA